jgi:hypothetical protein
MTRAAVPVFGQPRPELIPQERELLVLVPARPIRVLAVNDLCLVRVQVQADLRQGASDSIPHLPGLLFAGAVHHCVVAVPLKPDTRELPGHPGVESVVHEQIGDRFQALLEENLARHSEALGDAAIPGRARSRP